VQAQTWPANSGEESDAVGYSDDEASVDSDESDYDDYGPESKLTRTWLEIRDEQLPTISVVTNFDNQDVSGARQDRLFQVIWPQSWCTLLSCLPNAEAINLYAFDNERRTETADSTRAMVNSHAPMVNYW
jgi:hypothetical protein